MTRIGRPTTLGTYVLKEFTGDAFETVYDLGVKPGSPTAVDVYIGNVPQFKSYTVQDTFITFDEPPADGEKIHIKVLGKELLINHPANETVDENAIDTSRLQQIRDALELKSAALLDSGDNTEHTTPSGVNKAAVLGELESAGYIGAESVVRQGYAERTTENVITTTTYASPLTTNFTPKYDNSLLIIKGFIPRINISRDDAGLGVGALYRLRCETDNVNGPSLTDIVIDGVDSSTAHVYRSHVFWEWRYTVNSTATRNFILQYAVAGSGIRLTAQVTEGISMSIEVLEIKQ